jgi:hypothetical protein
MKRPLPPGALTLVCLAFLCSAAVADTTTLEGLV